jgi:sugar lactone lactonase YvrE
MKRVLIFAAILSCFSSVALSQQKSSPDDQYVLGADSKPQPGVPTGKTFELVYDKSKIFPGSATKVTVYIPAEYTAEKPACVFVGLDGLPFEVPTVFDNLIYKHEMPVTIAIGVQPGVTDSVHAPQNPRFNRSVEFDGLSDSFARFLLEEVFPEVQRQKAPSGLPIVLSSDPNDRAAGGMSTGGIGSFTLAWDRPDAFRRVFTAIGTFVGMRGGDRYAVLVRKTEPKPIRVFMEDGSNDELPPIGEVGDWWLSNQTMFSALQFAGYQLEHVWGEGTHSGKHATSIFPDAMRWLWKDWPQPITAGESQNTFFKAILQPGESWQVIAGDYSSDGILAGDPQGTIVFHDTKNEKTLRISDDGRISDYTDLGNGYAGLAFGPDGRIYLSEAGKILARTGTSRPSTITQGIRGEHMIVTHESRVYVTEPGVGGQSGKVWLVKPDGTKSLVDSGLHDPAGIAISPDGLWLAVAEGKTHWGYSYRIQPDGTAGDKQQLYWFHVPDEFDDSGAGPWVTDREGRLYSATRMGVQVFDRNGRSRLILPLPGGRVTAISFGGSKFDTLFVSCADGKIYRRKLKIAGAPSWIAPIELPTWYAG